MKTKKLIALLSVMTMLTPAAVVRAESNVIERDQTQNGVFIAGEKITTSGTYYNETITVDLDNHKVTLNNANISVTSTAVTQFDMSSVYANVVCLYGGEYITNNGNPIGYYYNQEADNPISFATAGLILADDNDWTVELNGENTINVTASFSYPYNDSNISTTYNRIMAGDAYGIYARKGLTIEGNGSLNADIVNNAMPCHLVNNKPATPPNMVTYGGLKAAGLCADNITISSGTITATTDGTTYYENNRFKYVNQCGALYADNNITISGGTVTAKDKLAQGAGIYSHNGKVEIQGGTVNAASELTTETSSSRCGQGIRAYTNPNSKGEVVISGGTVTVTTTGGNNTTAFGNGIYYRSSLVISGADTKVKVAAENNGIYRLADASISISEAEVLVTGKKAINNTTTLSSATGSISTGTYSSTIGTDLLANGYKEITEEKDGKTYYKIVKDSSSIANVGNEEYATVDAAISAANGETVTLNENVSEDLTVTTDATLDLNNKSLDISKVASNGGKLTIAGSGTITGEPKPGVELELKGGTTTFDPQIYLGSGYAEKVGSGTYEVVPLTSLNAMERGTVKSAIDNGEYEQMTVDTKTPAVTAGKLSFTVSSKGNKNIANAIVTLETTVSGTGDVRYGLIVTGIPDTESVTITLN